MTYKLTNINLPYNHNHGDLDNKIKEVLGISEFDKYFLLKQSIDARKKHQLLYTYTIVVDTKQPIKTSNKSVEIYKPKADYLIPKLKIVEEGLIRPVIVGSGPAGLFCGLILAKAGLKPIIIERGQAVSQRVKTTQHFFETGELCTESNIQFGEGGAGTFSDGKLSTGIKDKFGRKEFILQAFIDAGAPAEILYSNKPHIGTDYLIHVVEALRNQIIALGGDVHFNSKMTAIDIVDNKVAGIEINQDKIVTTKQLVLAIGHSARDTFEVLAATDMQMEQKAFAIGLRVEHPQNIINESQYGKGADMTHLPVADYKLTYRTKAGRGVYTFCMCPGGYVVSSASETGQVVCNGMSYFNRSGKNANAAILVNINPEDFGSKDILAGVEFQRNWERKAFELGGSTYAMPIQKLGDFNQKTVSNGMGMTQSNAKGNVKMADLNQCLPTYVSESIKEAMKDFGQKIKGFAHPDTLLTGVETRSSSPIRMVRNEALMSSVEGIYPCGEGAGYAGGIMSAAIDGIKVAEMLIESYMKC